LELLQLHLFDIDHHRLLALLPSSPNSPVSPHIQIFPQRLCSLVRPTYQFIHRPLLLLLSCRCHRPSLRQNFIVALVLQRPGLGWFLRRSVILPRRPRVSLSHTFAPYFGSSTSNLDATSFWEGSSHDLDLFSIAVQLQSPAVQQFLGLVYWTNNNLSALH
jgi:hypothetical protein